MIRANHVEIDARVSTAVFLAIAAASLFVVATPWAMAALLAYVVLLYAVGAPKGDRRSSGRHLVRLMPAVALIVVLNGLLVSGEAVLSVGGKTVLTKEGVVAGVFFSLRLMVLYATAMLFLAVTTPVEFAGCVHSVLRPFSRKAASQAAFYGFLVLSFVPLFSDELERIRLAQAFRGADLTSGGIARRAGTARALIVPMVVSAIHRSGQLAAVVELRGLRDQVGPALSPGRPGLADAVFAVVSAVALVGIARFGGGTYG
jgi:energy-coupling factor transporter transmembrane protein EcfT